MCSVPINIWILFYKLVADCLFHVKSFKKNTSGIFTDQFDDMESNLRLYFRGQTKTPLTLG